MKLSNRILIITGQNCIHIILHLLVIVVLLWGWQHQKLLEISTILLILYLSLFIYMLCVQHIPSQRYINDFLEDLTTTYYFGANLLFLLISSLVIHSNVLLGLLEIIILMGPLLFSFCESERLHSR